MGIWGPWDSETAWYTQVVAQKIVIFALVFGFLIEGWGMWQNLNDPQEK